MNNPADKPSVRKIAGYGYRPDLPDHRDHFYTVSAPTTLPASVDLRANCPPVYDQGAIGSCTANAVAALFQYNEIVQKKASPFVPSRLFIYYNERYIEGSTSYDSGATLRDGIRSLHYWGVVDENLWPYHIQNFRNQPTAAIYEQAKTEVVSSYSRIVQKIADLRTCLAEGHPFTIGITVYESFESKAVAKTGVVNMPQLHEKNLGGHAVLVVGYDDTTSRFLVRNSWGPSWGQQGYFTMPYEYVLSPDLTEDIWTVRMVP